MKRVQLACYALLAAAFLQGGLLCYALQGRLTPAAHADLVISRDNYTLMTAPTRRNEEGLFILENNSQVLLIYTVDIVHNRMERRAVANLADLFGVPAGGGGGARPSGPRER